MHEQDCKDAAKLLWLTADSRRVDSAYFRHNTMRLKGNVLGYFDAFGIAMAVQDGVVYIADTESDVVSRMTVDNCAAAIAKQWDGGVDELGMEEVKEYPWEVQALLADMLRDIFRD